MEIVLERVKGIEAGEIEQKGKSRFQRDIEVSYLGGTFCLTLRSESYGALELPTRDCIECPL